MQLKKDRERLQAMMSHLKSSEQMSKPATPTVSLWSISGHVFNSNQVTNSQTSISHNGRTITFNFAFPTAVFSVLSLN